MIRPSCLVFVFVSTLPTIFCNLCVDIIDVVVFVFGYFGVEIVVDIASVCCVVAVALSVCVVQ